MFPESELDHDNLIQRLVESVVCADCGASYETQDVHVIAQDEDAWTLVALCPVCGQESLVQAFMDIVTADDTNPPDLGEVVAWRRFLTLFNGDVHDLLKY